MQKILAINPLIYDFSAYDLWLKPYGFLHIISLLKKYGAEIYFLDFLDRFHPQLKNYFHQALKTDVFGCGKLPEKKVPKPEILKFIPRYYRRYGWPEEFIKKQLRNISPDLILMTSSMTYWYPGVKETIEILKNFYPSTIIILGGTYATLCPHHAQNESGADFIITNSNLDNLSGLIQEILKIDIPVEEIYEISPAYEVYPQIYYVALRTSWGCPFNCSYCGVKLLQPEFKQRNIDTVLKEIKKYYQQGIRNFAFYDDALLFPPERIKYLLKKLAHNNISAYFHTPNGLHARFIDQELANLMQRAKFINPRLSLESRDENFQKNSGGKVSNKEIEKTVFYLRKAGYNDWEYSIYLLFGLPEEDLETVRESIFYVRKLKAQPQLAEYSPVPGTAIAQKIKYSLNEPLFQNNSIFPAYNLEVWPQLQKLKNLARIKVSEKI